MRALTFGLNQYKANMLVIFYTKPLQISVIYNFEASVIQKHTVIYPKRFKRKRRKNII